MSESTRGIVDPHHGGIQPTKQGKVEPLAWMLLLSQVMLSTVLAVAVVGKFLSSEQFEGVLRRSYVPERLIRPVVVTIPVAEITLAVALVMTNGVRLVASMAATAGLLGVFTVWMVWAIIRRPGYAPLMCGCFGAGRGEIGLGSLGRNIVLLVVAIGGLALSISTASPLPGPSLHMVIVASSLGLALALIVALRFGLPGLVIDHASNNAVEGLADS